jgi:tagaturonate epimerase
MKIGKFSFGIGDRFAHQGKAQLQAMIKAKQAGIDITPVWNKSHREHSIIHTVPGSIRAEADNAVKNLGWKDAYFVDADHINLNNVDLFIKSSDFFTLDVADYIGKKADDGEINAFVQKYKKFAGVFNIGGIKQPIEITTDLITAIAKKFLFAVIEAGRIYRRIEAVKGKDNFVTEVSMDETNQPQSPVEMLFILAAIADQKIPAQTIAPKFTGRFNKGVDYVGNVAQFEKEFNEDLAVIAFAVKEFGLPENLKMSVHSGSDKFSIYAPINRALKKFNAGLHIKTAGTTWLEELIGLASAGGEGLEIAKEIYAEAFKRFDELCGPYATVIDIDKNKLPLPETVAGWDSKKFADTVRHNQNCGDYNNNVRQLLHVGYKVAAEMGRNYLDALEKYEDIIASCVTENIFNRHITPLFIKG